MPVMVSMPTIPSSRPSAAMVRDLAMDPPLMYASTSNPRTNRAKFSGGPNRRANSASGGASNEGADRGHGQRGARPSLLRHGVAVDARHHRRGLAGDAHEDGGG